MRTLVPGRRGGAAGGGGWRLQGCGTEGQDTGRAPRGGLSGRAHRVSAGLLPLQKRGAQRASRGVAISQGAPQPRASGKITVRGSEEGQGDGQDGRSHSWGAPCYDLEEDKLLGLRSPPLPSLPTPSRPRWRGWDVAWWSVGGHRWPGIRAAKYPPPPF